MSEATVGLICMKQNVGKLFQISRIFWEFFIKIKLLLEDLLF